MEILFAAGHMPSRRGRQAGQKTSYHICEYLARRHRVHLLALAPISELAFLDRDDMGIFASWETMPVTNQVRLLGMLTSPTLPLAISARHSVAFRRRLRSLARDCSSDVVIFDHTAMFQYVSTVPSSAMKVASAHDIYVQTWRRKVSRAGNPASRLLFRIEESRMERWETNACAACDLVITHNDKDKRLLESLEPRARVIAIDPWSDPLNFHADAARESGSIIFLGAMDRRENSDAARWIVKEILPVIRREVPGARLYIAGSKGERLAQEFAGRDDVLVTGFVEDIGSLMARMEIALLPLRLGAGIKIKMLECMTAGLPIVTTSVGAEGIGGDHGTHYLVAEVADAIAEHTVWLFRNTAAAREMGARARKLVTESRDFEGRMSHLEHVLTETVAERLRGGVRSVQ